MGHTRHRAESQDSGFITMVNNRRVYRSTQEMQVGSVLTSDAAHILSESRLLRHISVGINPASAGLIALGCCIGWV